MSSRKHQALGRQWADLHRSSSFTGKGSAFFGSSNRDCTGYNFHAAHERYLFPSLLRWRSWGKREGL